MLNSNEIKKGMLRVVSEGVGLGWGVSRGVDGHG